MATLKTIIETTHTRLLGLEAAFTNLQEKYLPITSKSKNVIDTLNNYFHRLDLLTNQVNKIDNSSNIQSSTEKKLNEMDKKLDGINNSMFWIKGLSIIAFLIVWPPIVNNSWKLVKIFIEGRFGKK